jgi:hypothetical protein
MVHSTLLRSFPQETAERSNCVCWLGEEEWDGGESFASQSGSRVSSEIGVLICIFHRTKVPSGKLIASVPPAASFWLLPPFAWDQE